MVLRTAGLKWSGILAGLLLLIVFLCCSIVLGYTDVTLKEAYQAFFHFEQTNTHIIIKDVRLPRALIAAVVGASLAIAGVLMQALTRNPLASPGIFGINAGASLFVVLAVSYFQVISLQGMTWISFAGAAVAAIIVYVVGSVGRQGLTPVRLTLAGAAIAALFSSFTQGMLVLNEKALDEVLFWLAGSVQGRSLEYLSSVFPYLAAAWIGSLLISRHINILIMGEDVAQGLGQKTGWIKAASGILIVLLAGGAVAIAGPIGFIGIVVPHFARSIVGQDHRWVIPYAGILGATLLLAADIAARYVIMPEEVPVGVMTAIIGTPFFIYIARKGLKST
ncbi:siderophore ABC transporter permease [Thalassobacillus devorans]|uniref:Siderophore ABC transporter permease n=1 Tax=Thalassobacillus devorans TaxID=279813 RepID=A0ABQ1PG86_9BACI|nr:iron ABC transporter permease [Thalassobacillus devorans]NIK29438.1 iron complex transport system permease protein [Thalassobacillus devorans]GGC96692.1 siderophore ABC transporter permease [Thalassobacillus devorans]